MQLHGRTLSRVTRQFQARMLQTKSRPPLASKTIFIVLLIQESDGNLLFVRFIIYWKNNQGVDNMDEVHTYETQVSWNCERKGTLSSDGFPSIEVATPPEFPKGHPGIWSPEHLFVAAAEICLMTTFLSIADNSHVEFVSYSSRAVGTLEKLESGFMVTGIHITPTVVITDEANIERVRRLLEKAEKYCLISNSMKTEVTIDPQVLVK